MHHLSLSLSTPLNISLSILRALSRLTMDQESLKTIENHPIGGGLDDFRANFQSIYQVQSPTAVAERLENLDEDGSTAPGYFRSDHH